MYFQEHRPWNPEINRNLHYIYDAGIADHLIRLWISPQFLLPEKLEQPPLTAFQLEHIFLGLLVYGAGIILGAVVLALEVTGSASSSVTASSSNT